MYCSSRALCEGARLGKYYHRTYFCRKAALLCSGVKVLGAGVITGILQLCLWDGNAFARPLVLQMSIGSGDHLTSGGPSDCLPSNDIKKSLIST